MGGLGCCVFIANISYQNIWKATESSGTFATSRSYDVDDFSSLTSLSLTREGVSDQTGCLELYQYEPLTQEAEELT